MANTNALDRAIELIQRAVDDDVNQRYAEAYKQYQNSIDYFMLALKYEKDDTLKTMIRAKVTEYLGRAEKLKEHLSKSAGSQQQTPVMATTSAFNRAIEIVQRAIDEDIDHNYAEAYKLYQNSLDYFMLALKYEENDKLKTMIREKVTEYLGRAEKLKEHISKLAGSQWQISVMANTEPLDRATEMVQRAIDEDMNQNYVEAYKQYQISVDYFMLALKYEKNDKLKTMIRAKITEYLDRIEKLEELLPKSAGT